MYFRAKVQLLVVVCTVLAGLNSASAYSVLTHEEIVDLLWDSDIQPALQRRFPDATPEEIRKAHAYAYGGSVIQDMGYYPFGSREFSDLTHYVRSGDFVQALFDEARTPNEYAFAIGALAHYTADVTGHPAVNRAVAMCFPKLRARFGDRVTYAESPTAHIRTEFGFDVAQVAKRRYAPEAYHDFIGFEVAEDSLRRAFRRTYGVELGDVFTSVDLSIGSYRRAVSKVIPEMTKAALLTHRVQLNGEIPNFNEKEFVYHLSRASYERDWGRGYRRPGFGARVLAFLFKLVPKRGPFKAVAFETPTPQTEDLYFKSVNGSVEAFRGYLRELRAKTLQLPDVDFDTGKKTAAGEYELTDQTYCKLLHRLAANDFRNVDPKIRSNLFEFFGQSYGGHRLKKKDRERAVRELESLRAKAEPVSSEGQ